MTAVVRTAATPRSTTQDGEMIDAGGIRTHHHDLNMDPLARATGSHFLAV